MLVFSQQKVIIGTVVSEDGAELPGSVILNMRTEERTYSDSEGHFVIPALPTDEIRIVRQGFDRVTIFAKDENFTGPLKVSMVRQEQLIEEIVIGFVPTGNLKKDLLRLETAQDRKVASLNKEMTNYMKGSPTMVMPTNRPPSSFAPQNIQGGLNLGKVAGMFNKAKSSSTTNPSFAETQQFYTKVLSVIDVDYFSNVGIVDYDLERLIAFADGKFHLAKKYRNNFNKAIIMESLKLAINDFKKTNETVK